MAADGARVVVHGTDPARAAAVVDEIEASGGEAASFLGAVQEPSTAAQLTGFACTKFGSVDIFVANVGIVKFAGFLEMAPSDFDHYMQVNVTAAFATAQAAACRMVEAGKGGRILFLGSISGIHALPGYAAYCASKSAVMSLARVAAVELAPHRITVNAICPGPVKNEMMDQLWGEERLRDRARSIPAGRLATSEEIAEIAAFLVSPAADYITGQSIFIDGGSTAAGLYTHEVWKRAGAAT